MSSSSHHLVTGVVLSFCLSTLNCTSLDRANRSGNQNGLTDGLRNGTKNGIANKDFVQEQSGMASRAVSEENATRFISGEKNSLVLDKSGYLYDPLDTSCDGFPRLKVQTMPGTCIGLVLPRARAMDLNSPNKLGFVKPRTIVQVPGTPGFLVVDMGGWANNNGRLFWLRPTATEKSSLKYELKLLKSRLANPHGLALGPDGLFYIGEKTQISRFSFNSRDSETYEMSDWELVIGNFTKGDSYMHPLSQFVFNKSNGDLFINSGSPSDHCFVKTTGSYSTCPEEYSQEGGKIFRVPAKFLKNIPAGGISFYEVAASGLRNSMAMTINSKGYLIQGENSRDFPELEEPYEEINVVNLNEGHSLDAHYGWPYCYDFHALSPEWKFTENQDASIKENFLKPVDCSNKGAQEPGAYQPPLALMPPHVSPLHMDYYKGSMFQDILGGQLIVTWHGYQPTGHRLVAYKVTDEGLPQTQESEIDHPQFNLDQKGGCQKSVPFSPEGGLDRYAPYTEVISGWSAIPGVRPKGAPVSFTVAEDGSIWIVEDRDSQVIVRLAKSDKSFIDSCEERSESQDPRIELLAWRHLLKSSREQDRLYSNVQEKLFSKYCTGCHGNFVDDEIQKDRFSQFDFMIKNEWIKPQDILQSKLYGAISHSITMTPMPPADKPQFFGTPEADDIFSVVKSWIQALPKNIEKTFKIMKVNEKKNIRLNPGVDDPEKNKICGQFQEGDSVYFDPRSEAIIKKGEWNWVPVYIVPNHSRLFQKSCAYPDDGVFYYATH